jgi:hypothetical protein
LIKKNIPERNVQVKRMREIYSKSWSVIVWLGEAADGSDEAVDLIARIDGLLDKDKPRRAGLNGLKYESSFAFNNDFGDAAWKPLYVLFNRPYWERVWIIQELAVHHNSTMFVCGESMLSRRQIQNAVDFCLKNVVWLRPVLLEELGIPTLDARSDIWPVFYRLDTLLMLRPESDEVWHADRVLSLSRGGSSTDDRDRIYGIGPLPPRDLVKN